MDLQICPSCNQSVLDDDPIQCPFCGAAMSGKAAPQAAAAKAAPPARKPAPKAKPASDDPFAIESAPVEAIPVSPRKTAQRTLEVVCPMCETAGYIPPAAAGRDVKCPNSACLAPIFTAPAPVKAAEPAAPPPARPSGINLVRVILATTAGVVAVGAVSLYFLWETMFPPPKQGDIWAEKLKALGGPEAGTVSTVLPANGKQPGEEKTEPAEIEKVEPPKDLRPEILAALDASAQRNERNRSKPFCRRMTAETAAFLGDSKAFPEQMERLDLVGSGVKHYRITPLVLHAFRQAQAGDLAGAGASIQAAHEFSNSIPQVGRDPLVIAWTLALGHALVGNSGAARALVSRGDAGSDDAVMAGRLVAARARAQWDYSARLPVDRVGRSVDRRSAVVAAGLFSLGKPDASRAWAEETPDAEARIEALITWAELAAQAALADHGTLDPVVAAAEGLDPAGRTRLLASVASVAATAGTPEAAEPLITAAAESLAQIPVPSPSTFNGYRGMLALELPAVEPLRSAALAAAELGRAHSLIDRPDLAWNDFLLAQKFCRAMTPGPMALAALQKQMDSEGITSVRDQLRQTFNLQSDDEAGRKYAELRRKIDLVQKAAGVRFQLQSELFEYAAGWRIEADLWREIEVRHVAPQPDDREPYMLTALPRWIADHAAASGKTELAATIAARIAELKPRPDPRLTILGMTLQDGTGDSAAAVARLAGELWEQSAVNDAALRFVCRRASRGRLDEAVRTALGVSADAPTVREEMLFWIHAAGADMQTQVEQWKLLKSRENQLTRPEFISAGSGLVQGLASRSP